ncbi:MAG: hypothetical protein II085_04480, partial [Alphaproteobacteria bacterium]|nr:hypothetical protein [Alphaproteobacteria bacterium]
EFNLIRCAAFLGKSVEFVKSILDLMEECQIIKIEAKNEDCYTLKILSIDNIQAIFYNSKYDSVMLQSEECEHFQKVLAEDDISEISSIIKSEEYCS